MRIPDPKANTTTEAYLAYKAGYLEESELKPVLYEPYLHFDGWLAYWAGLTNEYPSNVSKRNVLQLKDYSAGGVDVKMVAMGMIKVSGTTQNSYANFMTYQTPIDLKAGDYTFSRVGDKTYTASLTLYNEDKTQYMSINITAGNSSSTANIAFDVKYIAGAFTGLTVGSSLDFVTGLQLEVGSDASEFEPYAIPEMLCDEEALVAYLSGVTDTYPEEIKDPYDVRIVGYLKYLVSARWGRPDYPVNNEEFYLSNMKPPVVTNDTPSADIELDDTAEAPFIDVKAYGDTSQTTYTGKNLFDSASAANNKLLAWTSGNPIDSDGSVVSDYIAVSENTQVQLTYLSAVFFYDSSKNLIGHFGANQQVITTSGGGYFDSFTVPSGYSIAYIRLNLRASQGTNPSDLVGLDTMVNTGSELLPFEPYVGGVPAPNPDYPQDVNVVTGRQVVNVRGKNLLKLHSTSETVNGITFTPHTDGSFDISGTATANTELKSGVMPLATSGIVGGQSYTISSNEPINTNNVTYYVHSCNENGSWDKTLLPFTSSDTRIAETPSTDYVYFVVRVNSGKTVNLTNVRTQIEAGSTSTSFEPYQSQFYEINLGKNLLRFTNENVIPNAGSAGHLNVDLDDNDITFTSVDDFSGVQYVYYYTQELDASSEYTLSCLMKKNAGLQSTRISFSYSDNGTSWSDNTTDDFSLEPGQEQAYTKIFSGHKFYRFGFYNCISSGVSAGGSISYKNVQIELGSTATPYAPYFEPIELCKIGDYQDYIYRDEDGDWYVHKACNKVVFDGTEDWGWNNNQVFNLGLTDKFPTRTTTNPYCDNFIGQTTSGFGQVLDKHISLQSTATPGSERVLVKYLALEQTAPAFKTWLSTHNTTVYYPLATQTDTQITNSELITQLDALMEGGSYEGKTYIKVTATDPNLPGLLYVEAGKYD